MILPLSTFVLSTIYIPKGVENLRVCDASIMPQVITGNLNGPTIMIAERMSDIIRGKTLLPPANVPFYKATDLSTRR